MAVVHFRVEGRVQGVGFRWFVCQQADRLALAGWVRNTADGAVEVAARGDGQAIESLVLVAAKGPRGAYVRAVHRVPPPPGTEYPAPFRIEA